MTKRSRIAAMALLLVGLAGGLGVVGGGALAAPDAAAPAAFDATKTMAQNLAAQKGKVVTLHLSSGGTVSGKVEGWGSEVVHVSGLTGKELYDAVVRLDAIVAIEARAGK
ncbi:MAG: hypothetical protein U0166_22820 [Acidobacteriota bacterium]